MYRNHQCCLTNTKEFDCLTIQVLFLRNVLHLSDWISSDGTVNAPRSTGSLGKLSKKKENKAKSNKPLSKKERQRTANCTIQSQGSTVANPADQGVQVVHGNRDNKTVTIIRGMKVASIEEKKTLLKSLKSKLGVGGTLEDGVLEGKVATEKRWWIF